MHISHRILKFVEHGDRPKPNRTDGCGHPRYRRRKYKAMRDTRKKICRKRLLELFYEGID